MKLLSKIQNATFNILPWIGDLLASLLAEVALLGVKGVPTPPTLGVLPVHCDGIVLDVVT